MKIKIRMSGIRRGYLTGLKGTVFPQESLAIFSDAEKMFLTSDENLAVADCWGGVAAFAGCIFSNQFKLWPRSHNPGHACVGHNIHQPSSSNRCGAVSLAHSLLPMPLARLGLKATSNATVGYGQEKITHCNW